MNIITQKIKQNKGVAIVEYTVLAGLIGTLAVSSVMKLGDYIADSNNKASSVISEHITPSATVALTLADIRNAPYSPPARVVGRVYEDFVVVTRQDPATEQWSFSIALASAYNPAQILSASPSGMISGPFDGSGTAYALCVLASQSTGQLADPTKSMHPGVFGGSSSDIEINKYTFDIDDNDFPNALSAVYFDDANSPSSTSTPLWSSVSKPFNAIFAFTCSRPE